MPDSERFTLAKVEGGWQIYDVARHEHIGHVWHRKERARARLTAIQSHPPHMVRFILTGRAK